MIRVGLLGRRGPFSFAQREIRVARKKEMTLVAAARPQLKKKADRHEQHYLVGRSRGYCPGDNELFRPALGHPVYGRHRSLVRQERHTPNAGAAHRRRIWISPRFWSSFLLFWYSAAAAFTAVGAGTDNRDHRPVRSLWFPHAARSARVLRRRRGLFLCRPGRSKLPIGGDIAFRRRP